MRWVKHSWIFFRSLRPLTSKSSLGNKCPLFQLWNSMLTFIICLIYHSENIFVCVLVWPADVAAIADSTVSRNNLALSFQKTIRHIFIYNLSMISSPRNKSERTNHAMNAVKRHKKHCRPGIDKVCDLLFFKGVSQIISSNPQWRLHSMWESFAHARRVTVAI